MWSRSTSSPEPRVHAAHALRWAAALAMLLVLGLMGWHQYTAYQTGLAQEARPTATAAPQGAQSVPNPAWALAGRATQTADAAIAAPTRAQTTVTVCGLGEFAANAQGGEQALAAMRSHDAKVDRLIVQNLASNSSPRAHALAALSGHIEMHWATLMQNEPKAGFDNRTATLQTKLVQLAHASDDPFVYALAVGNCYNVASGACGNLNVQRWTQLEPDNAAAWLGQASRANAQGDPAARDTAISRAASSNTWQTYNGALTQAVFAAVPQSISPAPLIRAWHRSVILESQFWNADLDFLKTCDKKNLVVPQRLEHCKKLAILTANHARSGIAAMASLAVARNTGVSSPLIDDLKLKTAALRGLDLLQPALSDPGPDCESVKFNNDYLAFVVQHGELAYITQAAAGKGISLAELASLATQHSERLSKPPAPQKPAQ